MSSAAEAATTARTEPRVRTRKPWRKRLARIPFYVLIAAIFVYTVFPFIWAIRSSITPDGDLFSTPLQYIPANPTLAHYREVLSSGEFQRALINSTIVAGTVTLISLALGSIASYALGRFRFRGRAFAMYLMLSMTIFPQIAILGALFTLINKFGLFNTLPALIFSDLILTLPFTVWVLTSFMAALPKDLEEAAYVDGATPLQVFYKVLLPLIAPGLVTTGLLAFITAWNEYLYALSFTQDPQHHTITVAITTFTSGKGNTFEQPWGQIMAATVVVTIPLIVLTLMLQRRILAGLTAGAVKG